MNTGQGSTAEMLKEAGRETEQVHILPQCFIFTCIAVKFLFYAKSGVLRKARPIFNLNILFSFKSSMSKA